MSGACDRTKVKNLVVHHLGNGKPPIVTREELLREANPPHPGYPNGYQYPEYEWGILASGEVVEMRPLTVVGAHTTSDRTRYMLGDNWWNIHAASIVISCDCSLFTPTAAQVNALIVFIKMWNDRQCATLDNVYEHLEVTQTECPGKLLPWGAVVDGVKSPIPVATPVVIPVVPVVPIVPIIPIIPVVPVKRIADDDVWLSVRVRDPLVDQAILAINKLGFACQRLPLA